MKEDSGIWYEQRVLGSGGFGDVVLWQNYKTEESVAIKKCRIQDSISQNDFEKLKQRWCQEVEWLKKIKTEYIVQTVKVDFFSKNNNPLELPDLVMEYCDGGDLRSELNLLKNSSGLKEFEIRNILQSLRNAVSLLHTQYQITHRDIKPENIVIKNTKDGRKQYKLTDLGYAKLISVNTVEASMVGTKDYFAPEIIKSFEYSNSVDYWSIGVIGFEIITGIRPFVPHQSIIIWVDQITNKKSNVIAITENNDGQFIKHSKIFAENQICDCFKNLMEMWLTIALEYNRKSRGQIVELSKTQPIEKRISFFDRLDFAINSRILTVFYLNSYEFYSYQVDENMTLTDLIERIIITTGIELDDLYWFTPRSHSLLTIKQNTQPMDLYMENWTENRPMLYITRVSENLAFKPKAIYIPSIIKFVKNEQNLHIKNFVLQEYVRNSLFFLRNENKYYLVYREGLKNYALSMETEIMECQQQIEQIKIETYKLTGSSDTLSQEINYGINLVSENVRKMLEKQLDSVINTMAKLVQVSQSLNIRYNSILRRIRETIKTDFLNNTNNDFFNVKKMETLYESMTASNKTHYLKLIGELIEHGIKIRCDLLASINLKKTRAEILFVHVEFNKIKNIIATASKGLDTLKSQIKIVNESYQNEIINIGNLNQPISSDIDMPNMDELTRHLNLDNGCDYLQPRTENESLISICDDTQEIINESHRLISVLQNRMNDEDMNMT